MRADPLKQQKFAKLTAGSFLTAVVVANRAYLGLVATDAAETERDHWSLSCLPGMTGRLSAISMRRMEVFVVFEREEPEEQGFAGAFVVARRSRLERLVGAGSSLGERFPDLKFEASTYADA